MSWSRLDRPRFRWFVPLDAFQHRARGICVCGNIQTIRLQLIEWAWLWLYSIYGPWDELDWQVNTICSRVEIESVEYDVMYTFVVVSSLILLVQTLVIVPYSRAGSAWSIYLQDHLFQTHGFGLLLHATILKREMVVRDVQVSGMLSTDRKYSLVGASKRRGRQNAPRRLYNQPLKYSML